MCQILWHYAIYDWIPSVFYTPLVNDYRFFIFGWTAPLVAIDLCAYSIVTLTL